MKDKYDLFNIFDDIRCERMRQDLIHPLNDDENWVSILGEEFGEVCAALNDGDICNAREELIQVASVAVRWIEILDGEIDG